jgi:hypothetical protein
MASTNRITCKPIMCSHQGPEVSFAEQHAFWYEVRDECADAIGFAFGWGKSKGLRTKT